MNRRLFLRGTLTSIASSALVVAATSQEIEAFGGKRDAPVLLQHPPIVPAAETVNDADQLGDGPELAPGWVKPGDLLFNQAGEPVCYVHQVTWSDLGNGPRPRPYLEIIGYSSGFIS